MGNMSFVSIDFTLFFMIANTVLLFYVLSKLLFKPVKKIMDQRQNDIVTSMQEAKEAQERARQLEQDYQARIQNARTEASEIVRSASVRAQDRAEEIVEQAKRENLRLQEKAREDILREKEQTFSELRDQVADLAVEIAGKLIGKNVSVADNERLIQGTLQQIAAEGGQTWKQP